MIADLPIHSSHSLLPDTFRLRGRRYVLAKSGRQTLRLLAQIDDLATNNESGSWTLRSRPILRQISQLRRSDVVSLVILHAQTRQLRLIALWARGHMSGSRGTRVVSKFLYHPDVQIRKAAIRAMKKLNGHAHLVGVRANEQNPRLRRMAFIRPRASHEERLSRLTRRLSTCKTSCHRQEMYVHPTVDISYDSPPKGNRLIRSILNHIRRLVGRDAWSLK